MRKAVIRAATGTAAVGAALLTAPVPAFADEVFVEVSPSTIQAGFQVAIRASCGDLLNPASVTSDAFGTVTVNPINAYLVAGATVPEDKRPRSYSVKLTCPSRQTATTTIWVVGMDRPSLGPDTGGGALAGDGGATMISAGAAALGLGAGLALLDRQRRRRSLADHAAA